MTTKVIKRVVEIVLAASMVLCGTIVYIEPSWEGFLALGLLLILLISSAITYKNLITEEEYQKYIKMRKDQRRSK